jgi:hypothetical protein
MLSGPRVDNREPRLGHGFWRREWRSVGLAWPTRLMRSARDCETTFPPALGESSITDDGMARGVGLRYLSRTRSSRKKGCHGGLVP